MRCSACWPSVRRPWGLACAEPSSGGCLDAPLHGARPDEPARVGRDRRLPRRDDPQAPRRPVRRVLLLGGVPKDARAQRRAGRAVSGAPPVRVGLIGLGAIGRAAVGGIERVTHTTRKPASTLLPANEAAALSAPREIYRGAARAGVLRFPESANVAAAVSLAGIGFDRTELRVVADPSIERNRHEVVVEGAFGRLEIRIENVPTEENPRTGRIVP